MKIIHLESINQKTMRKLITLCAVFLLCLNFANASDNVIFKDGTISGVVIDATLNQPLPYVNVIVKNSKDETVTGGITLDDGAFNVNKIPEGTYIVSIQYIGFKTSEQYVTISR